jgi:hypothetical protein
MLDILVIHVVSLAYIMSWYLYPIVSKRVYDYCICCVTLLFTHFVCCSRDRFDELVSAILHHYAGLPEAQSGGYVPAYYWISAFAVNCNLTDVRKSPDSAFESVIHRCR